MSTHVGEIASIADVVAIERTDFNETVISRTTFDMFRSAAEQFADRTAIIFLPTGSLGETVVRVSHRDLFARITQKANMFHDLGVGPDDTVSFLMPNLLETQYVLWGAQAAGVANPINFLLQSDQIIELLKAAETKVLVTLGPHPSIDIWNKVQDIKDKVHSLEAVIRVGGESVLSDIEYDFHDLLSKHPDDHLVSGRHIKRDDLAAYYHTGGTISAPKLAMLTHGNQVHAAWGAVQLLGLAARDIMLNGMPLLHVGGTISCSLSSLSAGSAIIMLSPLGLRNPTIVMNDWKLIEEYAVTVIGGVPTVLVALTDIPVGDADISSARLAVSGASPLPTAVSQMIEQQSGKAVHQILGMTETAGVTAVDPYLDPARPGSVGIRLPFEDVKIVHLKPNGSVGDDCTGDEVGVLLVKGPNVFVGYKDNSQTTSVFTEDGWFISGDLAKIDDEGYITVVGRAKDVIIRSGHNIDPAVIEEAVEQHPAVQISAAVGQRDSYAGEVAVVYVTLRLGTNVDEAQLLAFVEDRISERPAMPHYIYILDVLPMTGVGKVFKPQQRCDAARRVIEKVLPPLKADVKSIEVDVRINSQTGMVARIKLSECADAHAVQGEITRMLDGFLFSYELDCN